MLLPLAAVLGLVAGLLTGGRLSNLLARRLRLPLVAVVALLVRALGPHLFLARWPLTPWLFSASLAVLVAWTWWQRHQFLGIWLVAAGSSMNLLVVVANGGRMPVPVSLAHLGPRNLLRDGVLGQYALLGPATRLGWLADTVHPSGIAGRVFAQAYSPGDLVVAAGLFATLLLATRPLAEVPMAATRPGRRAGRPARRPGRRRGSGGGERVRRRPLPRLARGEPTGDVLGVAPDPADERGGQRVLEELPDEVEAGLAGDHPALLQRPAVVAEDRQVDPAEVWPEPGAPDHVRHLEDAPVRQQRGAVPDAGHPRHPLDPGGGDVLRLDPDQRPAVGQDLRPQLAAWSGPHAQHVRPDEEE